MAALTRESIRLCTLVLATALVPAAPTFAADVSIQLDAGSGFSVKGSTGAIERLRVEEATGNVSRNGALFVHTTGENNLFIGPGAGSTSTTGLGGNSSLGHGTLGFDTTGFHNSAFGFAALFANTTGSRNSAAGAQALSANTTGSQNSAMGAEALGANTEGDNNSALGGQALGSNTTGFDNSAVGFGALGDNTTGTNNSAVGVNALGDNTEGLLNVAIGHSALRLNTTGAVNSAVGVNALADNTTGGGNSAAGLDALRHNTEGHQNAALGLSALSSNTTGDRNVAVGVNAGTNQTTGNDNIYLANPGVAGETGQIKIGTVNTHTQAQIAGIHGATSADGTAVFVNASGTLGTATSSARFKRDVRDMGAASDLVMKLRPVTFRYREEAVGVDETQAPQYGLIAEEVAEVAPELVAPDLEGRPYSVKYHVLPALLLNELQEQERANAAQQRKIDAQSRLIAEQREAIVALTGRVERLEAR